MEASGTSVPLPTGWQLSVRRHALGWLSAANLVGVLLAALLLWPSLGRPLGPFTYGRWMPLHLDWQLYGWCALPLVGVLAGWYAAPRQRGAELRVRAALGAWSLALALGGVSWLLGVASGKLFLDWSDWARPLLPLAMGTLWIVLAELALTRREGRVARWAVLAGLAPVPAVLYWAAGPSVYPAVDPDTGGATGTSLLGSTLGIVAVFALLPHFLGVRRTASGLWNGERLFWLLYGANCLVFALADHGDVSNAGLGQVLALASLFLWVPLGWLRFAAFAWTPAARRWLVAAFVWWLLLNATGWLSFLHGIAAQLKFTNGLVAHAHLAMAGLVTSMNFAILETLAPLRAKDAPGSEGDALAFWLWQAACAVHVLALLALGCFESEHLGQLFRSESWTQALYGLRLLAGLTMALVSLYWYKKTWR